MNRHSQAPQRGTFWLRIPVLAAVFVAIASSPSKPTRFGTLYISTNTTLTDNHEVRWSLRLASNFGRSAVALFLAEPPNNKYWAWPHSVAVS
jgi:hypothetical protein